MEAQIEQQNGEATDRNSETRGDNNKEKTKTAGTDGHGIAV